MLLVASMSTFQIQSDYRFYNSFFAFFFCICLCMRAVPVFDLLHCNVVQTSCKWQGPAVAALWQPPRLQSPPPREETPSKQRPMFPAQRPPTPQVPQVAHGPRQRPEGPLVPQPQRRTNQVVTPLRRMPAQVLPMQCQLQAPQSPQSPHLQSLRTVLTTPTPTPVQTPRQIQPSSFTPMQYHRQMPVAQPVPMCFGFAMSLANFETSSWVNQTHIERIVRVIFYIFLNGNSTSRDIKGLLHGVWFFTFQQTARLPSFEATCHSILQTLAFTSVPSQWNWDKYDSSFQKTYSHMMQYVWSTCSNGAIHLQRWRVASLAGKGLGVETERVPRVETKRGMLGSL